MPYQRSTEEETEGGDRLDVAQDRPAGHAAGTHRLAGLPPLPLRRRGGPTRAHSWLAAVVFALFYDAGDAIAGISTGILARSAQVGALGERAAVEAIETLFADPFKSLLFDIGRYAWIVALVLAAVALWRAGAPRLPLVLLALPAYLVTLDHAFPSGSLTFGTFFVIAAWLEFAPGRASSSWQSRHVR